MRKVLDDLRALEMMLDRGLFETGTTRIGAEQEMFLVDSDFRPAPTAVEVLEAIDDPRFTTELARFNLEANLPPIVLGEDSLSVLERGIQEVIDLAREGARKVGSGILLTGILPTLDKSDLSLDNMTPKPRYFALNEAVKAIRAGGEFELYIKGRDELSMSHDSVMVEACNTSFQAHFQVEPQSFARLYNIAQTVTAPVLAAATNSPLFFGRRLWAETRIAVFQQSVDTRHHPSHRRLQQPRVSFGERWLDDSVVEIFREDISRFRLLISIAHDEDPFAMLERGEIPGLKALCLHNGTVYRWNRPCYGITDGKPHLRIENRVLPAGPSVIDEVANAAFWFGLIKAFADEYGDIRDHLGFDTAQENFLAAARLGLRGQFRWLGERAVPADRLILDELLPQAGAGLRALGIAGSEADRYLDVIGERVRRRRGGSRWIVESLTGMGAEGTSMERMASLVAATLVRQEQGLPVHEWALARPDEHGRRRKHHTRVRDLMTTDLFTVNENDVIDLAAALMDWQHIRHVPVEDNEHRLVGLVTYRKLLRVLLHGDGGQSTPVRDVMQRSLIRVEPETPTLEVVRLMKEHKISALPVVENDRLVGIITERDLIRISQKLLEEYLRDAEAPG